MIRFLASNTWVGMKWVIILELTPLPPTRPPQKGGGGDKLLSNYEAHANYETHANDSQYKTTPGHDNIGCTYNCKRLT